MSAPPGRGRGRGRGRSRGRGDRDPQQRPGASSAPGGPSGGPARPSGPPPGAYQPAPLPVVSAWGRGAQRIIQQGGLPAPGPSGPPSSAPAWSNVGRSSGPPAGRSSGPPAGRPGPSSATPGPSSAAPSGPSSAVPGPSSAAPSGSSSAAPSGPSSAAPGPSSAAPSGSSSAAPSGPPGAHFVPPPVGPFEQPAEERGAEGRGGVRGRRRINEGESLLTRPDKYATSKQGFSGRPVDLEANYFQLMAKKDWCLYQYRIDFAPEEERTVVRKGLLRIHQEKIGSYIFDGSVMYTSSRLPQGLELFSKRQSDEETIRMQVRMVGDLMKGDYHYIQFFNIVMRKCLDHLNLKLVGRNFYDPQRRIEVRSEIVMQLWPGYMTSIRQCENNILMCTEISHKVMQQRTVYDILSQAYEKSHANYKKIFSQEILGQVVMTHYNNNTYRIDDVSYDSSPSCTFKLKNGKEISYSEYYRTKYSIKIRYQTQPLLVSKSKARDRRAGKPELIYLIPELCQLTGMSDQIRSNFNIMSALAEYTKLEPNTRVNRLLDFNKTLLANENATTELTRWGLQLDNKLITLKGRVLPKESIYAGNGDLKIQGSCWDREIRSEKMLVVAKLKDWVIIFPKNKKNEVEDLIFSIIDTAKKMDFIVLKPRMVAIDNDRLSTYLKALETVMSNSNPQLVMFVVPNNNMDRYSAIKKKCCVDRPVITQFVLSRTIHFRGRPNLTAATKIAIQMNTKLGGAPWTVRIPENTMVAGFDVFHDKSKEGQDCGAFVASLNKHCTRYFSTVTFHKNGEELSNDLSVNMCKALQIYKKLNGVYPTTIVFYRDGVGEGQVPFVYEIEVQNLKMKLEDLYEDPSAVKLVFIIVTKRINTRFFYQRKNVQAGTVVDSVVTNPQRFDFFLVSQSGGRGTITPSAYNVIYDTSNFGPDNIQKFTYKFTQMYFNFSGPVKVPAPCQYAHKLAALAGQALHVTPHSSLETLLYYL